MIKFFTAANLTETTVSLGEPWTFTVDEKDNENKRLTKTARRVKMLKPSTKWNVYSAVQGYAPNLRVSGDNPPSALHGLVVDYDMVSDIDTVIKYINQMPEKYRPNFIEVSLGNKIRLVWIFERPILTPSTEFCIDLLNTFFDTLGLRTLLPGFDESSAKPTEMWTNGAIWYDVRPEPLKWDFCFGVVCDVAKKVSLFNKGEIPLETIAAEVQKRFPNRWQGDFALNAQGVRFWDNKADNPTGCQIKPDGALCFTGKEPFVKWEAIFGRLWCEEQRILNLGRAAENIFFDGKTYWENQAGRWESTVRADIMLRLKGRGLSDRAGKGQTQSDAERVLDHIQQVNRVQGAAPLINYEPGLITLQGRRILNISDLAPVIPKQGTGNPEIDFPWTWKFLNGLFPRPELKPLDYMLTWLQRSYRVVLYHKRFMGQAVFLCGPRNNGKTLLCLRIVAPLMGGRIGNPIDYMTGETGFNSELFAAALLAVNDEDSPNSEAARKRMMAKLKGLVVNPVHKYHAKFEKPVTIDWTGRIFVTLNDDAGSVGMLMEVERNTVDKQHFFATKAHEGVFPPQDVLEKILESELPYFAWWLDTVYMPPPEIISDDRMGMKSFFDPKILELSNQQTFSSNLDELLDVWIRSDVHWADEAVKEWTGTPTDLLTALQTCDPTAGIAREWSQQKVSKSLNSLAKQENSRVQFLGDAGRDFKITRKI